jgi:ADP-ribosylglycohydrolase
VVPEPFAGVRRTTLRSADRVGGLLLGCAIGDALGMAVEGADPKATLRALDRLGGIRDFVAPQPNAHRSLQRLRPGCWTDETQLTMAFVQSILREGELRFEAIARAYVGAFADLEQRAWDAETRQACLRLSQGTAYTRAGTPSSSSLVAARVGPVAAVSCARGDSRDELLASCRELSTITHRDACSTVGAYLVALLIRDALASSRRWEPAPDRFEQLVEEARWAEAELARTRIGESDDPLSRHLAELCDALDAEPRELAELSGGAVTDARSSIPFCVALLTGRAWDFEDGVIAAIRGGGDTDTNGAIVGAVLGAAYGVKKIPRRWVDKVEESELIKESAALFAGWLGR